MKDTLTNISTSQMNAQYSQNLTTSPTPVESPSAWMQYGTSPTEIILATAVVICKPSGFFALLPQSLR